MAPNFSSRGRITKVPSWHPLALALGSRSSVKAVAPVTRHVRVAAAWSPAGVLVARPVIWHGIRVGPKNMFRKLHMIGYALILSINRILSTCLSERGGAHPLSRMNFTCFVT